MEAFDQLKAMVESADEEMQKAEAGNKAAGTRVRKLMQDVKTNAQAVRTKILEMRDAGG